MAQLPPEVRALFEGANFTHLATLNDDGSPSSTAIWAGLEGDDVVFFTPEGSLKARNMERDPRVAVTISDPANPRRYFQVRGRAINLTTEGGAEHIEKLSQRYTGKPYSWYGGRQQVRVIVTIEADHVGGMG